MTADRCPSCQTSDRVAGRCDRCAHYGTHGGDCRHLVAAAVGDLLAPHGPMGPYYTARQRCGGSVGRAHYDALSYRITYAVCPLHGAEAAHR